MTLREYKKIEEMQDRCKRCVFLTWVGGTWYCPFAGCLHDFKKEG